MFTVTQEQKQYLTYILSDQEANSQIEVVPERGAIISSWQYGDRKILYLDEARFANPDLSVRGGIPLLFPICGNLPDNKYIYDNKQYQLKQHGFARDLPWKVAASKTEDCASITLTLESNQDTLSVYPFTFELKFIYQLQGNRLKLLQSYTNLSDSTMPFSAGLHPYFLVQDKEKLNLTIPANSYFDHISQDVKDFQGTFDFSQEEIDVAFTTLSKHSTTIQDFHSQTKITIHYSDFYSTLVFWAIKGKDYVCLEPWSAPRNGLNTGKHLTFLEPGNTYKSTVEIVFENI